MPPKAKRKQRSNQFPSCAPPPYRPCIDSYRIPPFMPLLPNIHPPIPTFPPWHCKIPSHTNCTCESEAYCTPETCRNSASCQQTRPEFCPHGLKGNENGFATEQLPTRQVSQEECKINPEQLRNDLRFGEEQRSQSRPESAKVTIESDHQSVQNTTGNHNALLSLGRQHATTATPETASSYGNKVTNVQEDLKTNKPVLVSKGNENKTTTHTVSSEAVNPLAGPSCSERYKSIQNSSNNLVEQRLSDQSLRLGQRNIDRNDYQDANNIITAGAQPVSFENNYYGNVDNICRTHCGVSNPIVPETLPLRRERTTATGCATQSSRPEWKPLERNKAQIQQERHRKASFELGKVIRVDEAQTRAWQSFDVGSNNQYARNIPKNAFDIFKKVKNPKRSFIAPLSPNEEEMESELDKSNSGEKLQLRKALNQSSCGKCQKSIKKEKVMKIIDAKLSNTTTTTCSCHYPPFYRQLTCTGNLNGSCNCSPKQL